MKRSRPMVETNFPERRSLERRRQAVRCSHHTFHANGNEKCNASARWRCTGCGRFGCPRHRIRLENPEACSYCTGKIVNFVERRTSRRKQ
jgi:hypothetical protein